MNWKDSKTWTAIAGVAIAALSVFGLTTAEEGAALTASTAQAVSGIIGLVVTVAAIIKRRKSDDPKIPPSAEG